MGMKMTDLILPQAHIPMKDLEAYLKECKNRGVQLVFIVLSQLVENCYHEVSYWIEGISTLPSARLITYSKFTKV